MPDADNTFNFNAPEEPKCKHCGRLRGNHQAKTMNCPIGRGNFPKFHSTQVYAPRASRAKPEAEPPAAADDVETAEGSNLSQYPRPLVTVDAVLLTLREGRLQVALHQRPRAPFAGMLALPGGAVYTDEDVNTELAVLRVLQGKTGFRPRYLEQLRVFSGNARDPRGWSLSVAYLATVPDAELAAATPGVFHFYDVDNLPPLAFDHKRIIAEAVIRIRNKSSYSTLPCCLLPEKFTLGHLQATYEAILQTEINKSNFRRKIEALEIVEPVADEFQEGVHRPAQLYRLKDFAFFNKTLS